MAIHNGHATIQGIGADKTVGVGVFGDAFVDSLQLRLESNGKPYIGTDGNTAAKCWTDLKAMIPLTFRPVSDVSVAAAEAKAIVIEPGDTVTLSGMKPIKLNGVDILNGDWVNDTGSSITLQAGDAADCQLELVNYLGNQASMKTQIV